MNRLSESSDTPPFASTRTGRYGYAPLQDGAAQSIAARAVAVPLSDCAGSRFLPRARFRNAFGSTAGWSQRLGNTETDL